MPRACRCTPCPRGPTPCADGGGISATQRQGETHAPRALRGLEHDRKRMVAAHARKGPDQHQRLRRHTRGHGRTASVNRGPSPGALADDCMMLACERAKLHPSAARSPGSRGPPAQTQGETHLCAPCSCSRWITSAELRWTSPLACPLACPFCLPAFAALLFAAAVVTMVSVNMCAVWSVRGVGDGRSERR